ncbi:MAG: insulinase family protein [candidate division Zixibacteria bacterium]|nr:insulinase family protein [candidate division Zixibacteria bacterium]
MEKANCSKVLIAACIILLMVTNAIGFDFSKLEKSVTERTLDNGLKILVLERHDAPVVSFVTWVNVGGADDPKECTGLAHMFEHMAFKGTRDIGSKNIDDELKLIAIEDSIYMELRSERNKGRLADSSRLAELLKAYDDAREASFELVEPNEFSQIVEREGGVGLNAGTSMDFTMYITSYPSNRLELWMAMESARFANPVLREMYKERDVVAEERRMGIESSPFGRLLDDMRSAAFKAHPYTNPIVGHASDIQNYSREAAGAFYEKHYVPSNMVIAIVGDVKTKEVLKLAEKYWSPLPNKPKPEAISTIEPVQKGERRIVQEDPAQPLLIIGWHIPEETHPDKLVIDALVDYFGQGRTSLLYESLVKDKKIASQIGVFAGYPASKYPSLCLTYVIPSQGHTAAECEEQVYTELEKILAELIAVEEVEKIKARAKSNFVFGLDNNTGLAMQLAAYQTYWGDWHALFSELDRINAVTAQDIQDVAKKYFTKENRTVAIMNTIEN